MKGCALDFRALPFGFSSEVQVQSELDDAIGVERRAADRPKSSRAVPIRRREIAHRRIADRLRELRMIWQIEQIRRERDPRLLSSGNLEILLQREIEVVYPRIANIGEVAWRVSECLVDVGWPGHVDEAGSGASPRKIQGLIIKPKIHPAL